MATKKTITKSGKIIKDPVKKPTLNRIAKDLLLAKEGKGKRGRKPGTVIPGGYKKKTKQDEKGSDTINQIIPKSEQESIISQPSVSEVEQKNVEVKNETENIKIEDGIIHDGSNTDTAINSPETNVNISDDKNTEGNNVKNDFVKSGEELFDNFVKENKTSDEHTEKQIEEEKIVYKKDRTVYSAGMQQLVNGYMLLAFCDLIFPYLIKKVMLFFDKKNHDLIELVKTSDIQLTEDQKKSLQASADMVAAYVFEHLNPIMVFLISMSVFYYSNMSEAIQNVKDKMKEKPETILQKIKTEIKEKEGKRK